MRVKRVFTAVLFAAGLLVSPFPPAHERLGIGPKPALAAECKLEIEFCQEIDLVFYKTSVCYTVRLFCG